MSIDSDHVTIDQTTVDELSSLSLKFAKIAGSIATPAFVYEEEFITKRCEHLRRIADETGCKLLYTLKALTLPWVLELISPHVQGFSASSLFEAITARNVLSHSGYTHNGFTQDGLAGRGTVHLTTPGLRPDEVGKISEYCDYLSFNSVSQWLRNKDELSGKLEIGLRVNPEVSFLDDPRYDPCRAYSKLGAPITSIKKALDGGTLNSHGISGLLIHNNCNAPDFKELLVTVQLLESQLGRILDSSQWINLGGGYLFDKDSTNLEAFHEAVESLRFRHGLEVFIEPGSAFVRDAGFLVSTVLDLVENGGKKIAILDTSVNHLPESFEYEWRPDILADAEDGRHQYIIAGSTCLAGDVFGEYSFSEPLEIGAQVVMYGVGSYNLVKAHTFNGLPLPTIYALGGDENVTLLQEFTMEEQSRKWGF
ncbi:MAG: hypothetical protein BZY75_03865 [SAR202 cluster bacterium Io17-Chloro-G7]|nr:MAG: hypothetical protein BZY75_03865 [SAR202 cluster bacterium Io17-Chloro-G7]